MIRRGNSAFSENGEEGIPVFKLHSIIPSAREISRRMVEPRNLRVPTYDAAVVQVFDLDGNTSALYDPEIDNSINKMEILPIEAGYNLRFTVTDNLKKLPVLPLSNITDIKIVSDIKGLLKRKDRMIEITLVGNDRKIFIAKINFDDKDIDEIYNSIQKFKYFESDTDYWARNVLRVQIPNSEPKEVSVYSSAPFLANGEEIIWHNSKTDDKDGERKTVGIDVITNYRVLQYDYANHIGLTILLPNLEKIEIANTRISLRKNSAGDYSLAAQKFLTKNNIIRKNRVGDLIFFTENNPFVIFRQITDPETLSVALTSLKQNPIRARVYNEETDPSLSSKFRKLAISTEDDTFNAGLLPGDTALIDRGLSPDSREWKYHDDTLPAESQKDASMTKSEQNSKIIIDWSHIIGYEEIKHIIDAVLINKYNKKTHVLIAGHAGTSKTVFLKTIESSLLAQGYNAHYLDATTLSSSGVLDYLFNYDVTYCLLDELDKLEREHQSAFLNLLESGTLQETKYKKIRKKEMKDTIVIATGNYTDRILPPLLTRFLTLNIPKYTRDQFYDISVKLLTSQYGKTQEIAHYIADQIWNIYTAKRNEEPNMRQCVQVATLTGNTKESIDPILQGLATYSYKLEE